MTLKEIKEELKECKALYKGSGFVHTFPVKVERKNSTYANLISKTGEIYIISWKELHKQYNRYGEKTVIVN